MPGFVVLRVSEARLIFVAGDHVGRKPRAAQLGKRLLRDRDRAIVLDRGSNLLILALRDDRPVGILVGVETGHLGASPDLFIYGIVVREDLRGHGIAHRLVEKAVEVAEEAGCTRVWGSVHRHDEPDADVRGAGSPFAGVTASGGDDELTTRSTSIRSTTFVIPIP